MNDAAKRPARFSLAGLSQDFHLGLAIALFGVLLVTWLIPAQVDDAGSFGLPPSLAPKSLAWVMIACGLVLAAQRLGASKQPSGLRVSELLFLAACLLAVGCMLILMSYLGALFDQPNLGFLLSAPLGLIAFTYLHSQAPFWAYALNIIAAPLVIVVAFWWGLELPLP